MYLFEAVVGVSAQFKEDVENCEEARIYLKEVRKELLDAGKRRFEQGKVEGYLMEEADFEIVGSMLALQVVKMNEKKSERYTPNQVCLKSLMIILRGVCTEKGREVLDQIKESYTV